MALNWVALLLLALAAAVVVVGVKGTYSQVGAQLKALAQPTGGEKVNPPFVGFSTSLPHPGPGGVS